MPTTARFKCPKQAAGSGSLPISLRVLHVGGRDRSIGWLADAFAADSATEVLLEEATGMADGLSRMRDEAFEAVLISHDPPGLDALELVGAIRGGSGEDQAVIVLGAEHEREMAALCYEVGAEAYVCDDTCTTRGLIWTLTRAIEYRRVVAENRRLHHSEMHRSELEQEEARRVLDQQRRLVEDATIVGEPSRTLADFPEPLVDHYRELLRTYVIMGTGNILGEMQQIVRLHLAAGFTARDAMLLHVNVLEEMVHGLGSRSARHVMNRADVLILETMIHLSEGYRQQYLDRLNPPRQRLFPFNGDDAA
jgi:DNA-binding response OmpR family regulator